MGNIRIADTLKKYTMPIVLVAVFIFFSWQTEGKILIPQNLDNLLFYNAYVFILAIGMLMCILTGGNIDLAVGSVVCFIGSIGGVIMDKKINIWVAVLAMIAIGILVGLWQGFWIAYINVPPFIATLAGMYAFRGLANVIMEGLTVTVSDESFLFTFGNGHIPDILGSGEQNITCFVAGIIAVIAYACIVFYNRYDSKKRGYDTAPIVGDIVKTVVIGAVIIFLSYKLSYYKGIPTFLIWILVVSLIYGYITKKTVIGRDLYALGGNKKAAGLSGVNVKKVLFFSYVNMGLLAAFAGILTVAMLKSAAPTYGEGYEMDAIGACFIGGASAYGGIGTVPGAIIGALLMGVIDQGLNLMGIDANYTPVVKGLVLLLAVIFDVVSKREKK